VKAKAVGSLSHVFSMSAGNISQMIFTGVFDRFPELHVAWIEIGVGWLPHFIEMLDDKYWRNRSWGELPIGEPPSFYWRRNNSATFITDRSGIELRERVGVDTIMWSSDYPHHGNDWPYSRKVIEDTMGNIPAGERARMIGGNAVRIFRLEE
jgi:predicted TIM-barrel fold metal-dependent hydrolase